MLMTCSTPLHFLTAPVPGFTTCRLDPYSNGLGPSHHELQHPYVVPNHLLRSLHESHKLHNIIYFDYFKSSANSVCTTGKFSLWCHQAVRVLRYEDLNSDLQIAKDSSAAKISIQLGLEVCMHGHDPGLADIPIPCKLTRSLSTVYYCLVY